MWLSGECREGRVGGIQLILRYSDLKINQELNELMKNVFTHLPISPLDSSGRHISVPLGGVLYDRPGTRAEEWSNTTAWY